MLFLVVTLLVAIIPTGNYYWTTYPWAPCFSPSCSWASDPSRLTPSDYAICYFTPIPSPPSSSSYYEASFHEARLSMIISVLLLGLGFAFRIVKLYKSLSVFFAGRTRKAVSERVRHLLRKLYDRCNVQASPRSLRRTLC